MIQNRKKELKVEATYYNSPIGLIKIEGSEKGISSVSFIENEEDVGEKEIPSILIDCVNQLDEYFKNERKEFSVKLDLNGSPFQEIVWNEVKNIPYGLTTTYNEVAEKIRNKQTVRAVGSANSRNPVLIIIPCHRVIGTKGKLTGYSGGLWRKDWLINFENNRIQKNLF